MKKGKRRVRRLSLYLRSIGIQPDAAGIQFQYDQLEQEQRKLARRTGRRLFIEFGSIAKALMALANHTVQDSPPASSQSGVLRSRSREEQFHRNLSRWSPLTPPCPSCRMGCGFPKRSWPTWEWADEVRGHQHDRDELRVFQCPVQPGFWHLAHVGRRSASLTATKESLLPTIPTPPIPNDCV
jgi:hypothetical protein